MTHLWNKISQRDCDKYAIIHTSNLKQRHLKFRNELSLFLSNSILIVHASYNGIKKITSLECKWLHALSVYVD